MIPFFPTPYPDELWYGLITRFHSHSGFPFWSDSLKLLFPEHTYPRVGSLLPNETMRQLVLRLPEGILSLEELVLQHSLFSFRLLFLGAERKTEYLRQYLRGEDIQPKLLTLTKKQREHPLRYCPICAMEDAEGFGEAYWHAEHQIWIMPLCPVHGCRLVQAPCRTTMSLSRRLVLIPNQLPEPDFNATETDKALTALLHQWYQMPLEVGTSIRKTDNLGRAVENAGFLSPGNVRRVAWDTGRLYAALTDKFGVDVVTEIFGSHITMAHARRLRLGEIACTEEYALWGWGRMCCSRRIRFRWNSSRGCRPLACLDGHAQKRTWPNFWVSGWTRSCPMRSGLRSSHFGSRAGRNVLMVSGRRMRSLFIYPRRSGAVWMRTWPSTIWTPTAMHCAILCSRHCGGDAQKTGE